MALHLHATCVAAVTTQTVWICNYGADSICVQSVYAHASRDDRLWIRSGHLRRGLFSRTPFLCVFFLSFFNYLYCIKKRQEDCCVMLSWVKLNYEHRKSWKQEREKKRVEKGVLWETAGTGHAEHQIPKTENRTEFIENRTKFTETEKFGSLFGT